MRINPYDNGTRERMFRRADERSQWQSGTYHLNSVGIELVLPSNVRLAEIEVNDATETGNAIVYNRHLAGKLDLLVAYFKTGNSVYDLFLQGHEQGHLSHFTGNLSALYHETQRLGFDFYFFPESVATENDETIRKSLSDLAENGTGDRIHLWKPQICETIADISGLISLIKSSCNGSLIEDLIKAIESPSFFRRAPDVLERYTR